MPKDNPLSSHRNRAGKFFLLCTALGVCLGPASLSYAEPASTALPTGGSVVAGDATISSSGSQMNVNQSSDKTIINWNSFDIGSEAGVTFVQPSASSVALNRVTSSDVSEIYGSLTANGQLVLINPNGVIFGAGSSVDAASMVASTLNITNEDFLAGNYAFFLDGAEGSIENNGSISASSGGYVALLGASVSNKGSIDAPSGKVVLAAGESLELPLTSSGLISLEVGEADIETNITNEGIITATNGQVYISAQSAADIASSVVNKGSITAKDITAKSSDTLFIDSDSSINATTAAISASTITGAGNVTADTLSITGGYISLAGSFTGRDITLTGTEAVLLSSASSITADAANGGTIKITSPYGTVLVSGTVSAQGLNGTGGTILISGSYKTVLLGADINASGTAGGGIVYVGGGWQGDTSLVNTTQTLTVDANSNIAADATDNGTGGEIVFFSTGTTSFYGNSTARGGVNGGDGGRIELSGDTLNAQISETNGLNVLARADGYTNGTILIDPADLVIGDATSPYSIFTALLSAQFSEVPTITNFGYDVALSDSYALIGSANIAFLYTLASGTWTPLYAADAGAQTGEGFGYSVALSDTYALIGASSAYSLVNPALHPGMAYLYKISDGTWTVLDGYTAGSAYSYANFGASVALNATYALIGASGDRSDQNLSIVSGMAYLYNLSDGTWTVLDGLVAGAADSSNFGASVALSDSYALIGASHDYSEASSSTKTGMAYLYKIADGTWTSLDGYTAGAVDGAYFGNDVAITDTYALIGAVRDTSDVSSSHMTGMAYLYKISDGSWTVLDGYSAGAQIDWAHFGMSVAINSTYALISAYTDVSDVSASAPLGMVYLYTLADGTWTVLDGFDAGVEGNPPYFGNAVALSSSYILIGARGDNNGDGEVYLLSLADLASPADSYQDLLKYSVRLLPTFSTVDGFGNAVALSDAYALIGSSAAAGNRGTAYLYELATGIWTDLSATTGQPVTALASSSLFGYSVALSEGYALIGARDAYSASNSSIRSGMAYLYNLSDGTWISFDGYADGGVGNPWGQDGFARFGCAVALSDSYALIGASGAYSLDNISRKTGMAFLYTIADGTWTPLDGYTVGAVHAGDFGISVAINDIYALIGDSIDLSDINPSQRSGMAYLYKISDGTWTVLDPVSTGTTITDANFGLSVALNETYALIGAPRDYKGSFLTGLAYLYKLSDGTWTILDGNSVGVTTVLAHFGGAVALNNEYALIGAYDDYSDASSSTKTGMAYLYNLATSTWTILDGYDYGAATADDTFGRAIALSDHYALIGNPSGNSALGEAYLIDLELLFPDFSSADIQTLLASGNVTLTADNSITILDLSLTSADSGNSLSLISGGSIEAVGTITFGGREVTMVGNAASSALDNAALREAGAGGINVASTSSIDNSGGTLTLQIGTASDSERTGSYALVGDFVIAGSILADGIVIDGADSALTLSASLTEAGGDIVINTYETTLTGTASLALNGGRWFVYNTRTDALGTVDMASYVADFTQESCTYGTCSVPASGNGIFYAYPPASSDSSDTQATEDKVAALQRDILSSLVRALPQRGTTDKTGIFTVETSALSGGENLFSPNGAKSYLMLLSSIMEDNEIDLFSLLKDGIPGLKALKKIKSWQGTSLPEGLIFNPEKGFLEGLRGSDVYNLDIVGIDALSREHTVSVSLIPRG